MKTINFVIKISVYVFLFEILNGFAKLRIMEDSSKKPTSEVQENYFSSLFQSQCFTLYSPLKMAKCSKKCEIAKRFLNENENILETFQFSKTVRKNLKISLQRTILH